MSKCPTSEHADAIKVTSYLRKPDREFWMRLFDAIPEGSEEAENRRQRVARYALGSTAVISFLYCVVAVVSNPSGLWMVSTINGVAMLFSCLGMWMASLGMPNAPRRILLVTLVFQIGLLQLVTANYFFIVVFAPVVAVLARVLIPNSLVGLRTALYLYTVLLFFHAVYADYPPMFDVNLFPDYLLSITHFSSGLIALSGMMLLLSTYEREVLLSEKNLQWERERSDRLLNNMLPASIAEQLREGQHMIAERHSQVTVLFADIAGFTPWSSNRSPEDVVELLEKIFSRFDALVSATQAEKIKTIGDAYMVIAGAPEQSDAHAHIIADLALAMMDEVSRISDELGVDLDLRVGVHSGEVIAGVIGAVRFSYDVWGDTVNTASRMESHGEPGRIQISDDTYQCLRNAYTCQERGEIQIKGKGAMKTWWLQSRS